MTGDRNRKVASGWSGPRSKCRCGHTGDGPQSEHDIFEGYIRIPGFAGEEGHGACHVPGCDCKHFRWNTFLEEFSAVLKTIPRKES